MDGWINQKVTIYWRRSGMGIMFNWVSSVWPWREFRSNQNSDHTLWLLKSDSQQWHKHTELPFSNLWLPFTVCSSKFGTNTPLDYRVNVWDSEGQTILNRSTDHNTTKTTPGLILELPLYLFHCGTTVWQPGGDSYLWF